MLGGIPGEGQALAVGKLGIIAVAKYGGKLKAVNLPAWRKVTIDMEHIASGHMLGGSRVSPLRICFLAI